MNEGEEKELPSGFQTVFRGTLGGSLEELQGQASGDREKGPARAIAKGVFLPILSCLQAPHSPTSHFTQKALPLCFSSLSEPAAETILENPFSRGG